MRYKKRKDSKDHWRWYRNPDGYIVLYRNHPITRKRETIYWHRLLAEVFVVERPLNKDEVVHHKDGDISNNDPSNLVVMHKGHHSSIHFHPKRKEL